MNKRCVYVAAVLICAALPAAAEESTPRPVKPAMPAVVPAGYAIGPDDVLDVTFWGEKDLAAEVVVRPDGNIALPLIGDVAAAGLTPAELTARIRDAAADLLELPMPTVIVKQINSRKVSITGEVAKPGRYPLVGSMTVLELIALAGGFTDFADQKNIGVVRTTGGIQASITVNYKKLARMQDLHENIALLPGDIIVVR